MSLKVSISGIRGLYPDDLPEELIVNYINAYCSIQKDGDIIIGYDGRSHGLEILDTVKDAILRSNRNVTNIGLVPTPSIQFLANKYEFAGAVMVTASHNPIEWNGLKLMDHDGCFISIEKFELLKKKYSHFKSSKEKNKKVYFRGKEGHRLYSAEEHIDDTISLPIISRHSISEMNYNISIDTINGGGSTAIPMLLEKLNCQLVQINDRPGVPYPRDPEPRPNNLTDLSNLVKKNSSDIGLATDPDADRLCLVDENGHPIIEEMSLALCTELYCKRITGPQMVATNLSTSQIIDDIANTYGLSVVRTAVGEINVVDAMKEHKINFGGEGNGGVIYSGSHYGRDSIVGASMILSHLSLYEKTISSAIDKLPKYDMVKEKINSDEFDTSKLKSYIKDHYPKAAVNSSDGIKIVFKEKSSWVHIRPSNTEPVVRIIAETPSKQETQELVSEFKEALC